MIPPREGASAQTGRGGGDCDPAVTTLDSAAPVARKQKGVNNGVTSHEVFASFVTYDHETGRPDTSRILSKACFDKWMSTRLGKPHNPPRAFKDALKAIVTASNRSTPFPPDVEADLLSRVRVKGQKWPAFEDMPGVNIGMRGWRVQGFHEKARQAKTSLAKPHESKGAAELCGGNQAASCSENSGTGLVGPKHPRHTLEGRRYEALQQLETVEEHSNNGRQSSVLVQPETSDPSREEVPETCVADAFGAGRVTQSDRDLLDALATSPWPSVEDDSGAIAASARVNHDLLAQNVPDLTIGKASKRRDRGREDFVAVVTAPGLKTRRSSLDDGAGAARNEIDFERTSEVDSRALVWSYNVFETLCNYPTVGCEYHYPVLQTLLEPNVAQRFHTLRMLNDPRLDEHFVCPAFSTFLKDRPIYACTCEYAMDGSPFVVTERDDGVVLDLFEREIINEPLPCSECPLYDAWIVYLYEMTGTEERMFRGETVWGHGIITTISGKKCIRYSIQVTGQSPSGSAILKFDAQDLSDKFQHLLAMPDMFPGILSFQRGSRSVAMQSGNIATEQR